LRPTRRDVLRGGAGVAALALAGCHRAGVSQALPGRLRETRLGAGSITVSAAERPLTLPGRDAPTPAWIYGEAPFPVLRIGAGETLDAVLRNDLKEHSSIHWHGVRVPNAMDPASTSFIPTATRSSSSAAALPACSWSKATKPNLTMTTSCVCSRIGASIRKETFCR
jgi:FtsP/CotA-like multicopper oxidase with cupredoxin domain